MLRTTRLRIPRVRLAPGLRQRSLHTIPTLDHDFSEGVPGLFSAGAYDMAWTQNMNHTLGKLNALVAGTDLENRDTKQILHATARDPDQAPIFNHASMAHNTHFFFKTLSPERVDIPSTLVEDLRPSFSSLKTLRQEFVLTASSMFGPGFVWLVKVGAPAANPSSSLFGSAPGTSSAPAAGSGSPYAPYSGAEYRILATYLAGTPYPGAHWRQQPTDMNTAGAGDSAAPFLRNSQRAQKLATRSPGSLEAVPVLCLSTWEHVWLRDYGIGGKKDFVEAWWDSIDWHAVSDLAAVRARPSAAAPASA